MTEEQIKEAAILNYTSLKRSDHFPVSESLVEAFIAGAKLAMENEWIEIKSKEDLPQIQTPVLVYLPKYGTPNIQTMWIEEISGMWFNVYWSFKDIEEVTHWMPLPQPPKSN